MDAKPLVSVITATYNMAQYVTDAVDSVLAQDYERVQSIVVDDGSTDETQKVLERYADDPRVVVLRQKNAGQTVAKNQGIANAQGDVIGFCDADDRWLPAKLSLQMPILGSSSAIGLCYGEVHQIDAEGRRIAFQGPRRHAGQVTGKLLVDNFVPFPTAIVPREVLDDVGTFDENLKMSIDYDLWLRISVKYDFAYCSDPVAEYRIWDGQMSHLMEQRLNDFFRLMENFVARYPDVVTAPVLRRAWSHTLTTRGRWLTKEGRKSEAWNDFFQACRHYPLDLRLWKSMARLLLSS